MDDLNLYTWDPDGYELLSLPNGSMMRTHGRLDCSGPPCVIHSPTAHPMRAWPLVWRTDKQFLAERICAHNVGHPDPDSLSHFLSAGMEYMGLHGCDGCCTGTPSRRTNPVEVTIIAATRIEGSVVDQKLGYGWEHDAPEGGYPNDVAALSEFAGRLCYQSWDKPNPATQKSADYIAHIIAQGHLSVLEHASATLYIQGVSRSLLAELTRHRHLSFSVVSQRYCAPADVPVIPPALRDSAELAAALQARYAEMTGWYNALVHDLTRAGLPRKQAREAARSVLPNMTPVELVVTGNFRAWREVIARRIHPSADAEIQEFAAKALNVLSEVFPEGFADMTKENADVSAH